MRRGGGGGGGSVLHRIRLAFVGERIERRRGSGNCLQSWQCSCDDAGANAAADAEADNNAQAHASVSDSKRHLHSTAQFTTSDTSSERSTFKSRAQDPSPVPLNV